MFFSFLNNHFLYIRTIFAITKRKNDKIPTWIFLQLHYINFADCLDLKSSILLFVYSSVQYLSRRHKIGYILGRVPLALYTRYAQWFLTAVHEQVQVALRDTETRTSNRAKEQHGKTVKSADKLTVQVWPRYNCEQETVFVAVSRESKSLDVD